MKTNKLLILAILSMGVAQFSRADETLGCDTSVSFSPILIATYEGQVLDRDEQKMQLDNEQNKKKTEFDLNYGLRTTLKPSEIKARPGLEAYAGKSGKFSWSVERRVHHEETLDIPFIGYGNWVKARNYYAIYFTPDEFKSRAYVTKARCEKINECLANSSNQDAIESLTRLADTLGCQ